MRTLKFTNYMAEILNREIKYNYPSINVEKIINNYVYSMDITTINTRKSIISTKNIMIFIYNSETNCMEYHENLYSYEAYNNLKLLIERLSTYYPEQKENINSKINSTEMISHNVSLSRTVIFKESILISNITTNTVSVDKGCITIDNDINSVIFTYKQHIDNIDINSGITVDDIVKCNNILNLFIDNYINNYIINVGELVKFDIVAANICNSYYNFLISNDCNILPTFTDIIPNINIKNIANEEDGIIHVTGVRDRIVIMSDEKVTFKRIFKLLIKFLYKYGNVTLS